MQAFRVSVIANFAGDIAIDDISIADGLCSSIVAPTIPPIDGSTPAPSQWDCDFEDGNCGWAADTSDKLLWKRNQGPTPGDDTGPVTDHTTMGSQVTIQALQHIIPPIHHETTSFDESVLKILNCNRYFFERW